MVNSVINPWTPICRVQKMITNTQEDNGGYLVNLEAKLSKGISELRSVNLSSPYCAAASPCTWNPFDLGPIIFTCYRHWKETSWKFYSEVVGRSDSNQKKLEPSVFLSCALQGYSGEIISKLVDTQQQWCQFGCSLFLCGFAAIHQRRTDG